jgi:hypothetical protein
MSRIPRQAKGRLRQSKLFASALPTPDAVTVTLVAAEVDQYNRSTHSTRQISAFNEPVSVPRRQGDHFAERGLEAGPPPGAAQLRQEVARKGGPRFRHQEWTVRVGWLRPTLKT